MKYRFDSELSVVRNVTPVVPRDLIHAEPMLFGCSVDFARSVGGPLTRAALAAIGGHLGSTEAWCAAHDYYAVIDTRTHMLMPRQYPAIPGWHCDAVPRGGYGEQPDLAMRLEGCHHYTLFQSDQSIGVSRTRFVAGGVGLELEIDPLKVWESAHAGVTEAEPSTYSAKEGEVIRFSQSTLHTARPCHQKGWRWWFRLSCFYKPPENDVRRQVQVYATEDGGW